MEILKDRFVKFENKSRDIIFDVFTNRVIGLEKNKDSLNRLETVVDILDQDTDNINPQVLKDLKYEDGSNLAININLTPACNLKCVYCFAQGGNYGCLEKPMDIDIIANLDKLIRRNMTKSNKVRLEFFGGEPLLNFKVIKEILQYTKEFSKKENVDFIYRISTNLTYLNDEIIEILGENKFIISISIDGGKKVHDLLRPFKNNEGSFDTIMNNIKLIREKYEELILVARMTIAQKDSPIYENIEQLISTNYFDYVSIYPASVKSNENEGGKYKYYFDEDVKGQFDYVISNYEELFKLSARFKGILEYEKIYDEILNGKLTINHCAAGGSYFTLSGDKSVVPCHRVCGQKEFMMYTESGDLDTKIINNWTHKVDQNPTCSTCWARYICGGGCKQENLSANGDINKINLASCEYHKFILERLIIGMNSFTESFNKRNICVDDLFVYCGRPATFNKRDDKVMTELGKVPGVNLF